LHFPSSSVNPLWIGGESPVPSVQVSTLLLLWLLSREDAAERLLFRLLFLICPRTEDANSFAPCVIELRNPFASVFLSKSYTHSGDKMSLL